MSSGNKIPKAAVITIPVILIFAVAAYIVIQRAEKSRSDLPVYGTVPEFQFTSQHGEPFGTGDLMGKINIMDFFFTSCRGPCPVMHTNMSDLYELFKGHEQIQFVSISVDPENDTPEVLAGYARDFKVNDGRWVFLHAPIDSVVWLSENGFSLAADNLPNMHSTKFVLVDENAQIRGYYSGTDEASINIMITHIREMVKSLK
ncbi:MAG: SCO family protein [candidate division Zixibacteria bacterium]|nr:SCO family protein [candidate division Zixibacteria bacterium]